jgi:trans-aconitate methyltransferase
VLSLGVGRGDELIPFETLFPDHELTFTGVDHSASALEGAQRRFPGRHYRFLRADLNDLGALEGGRYDLVVSIATFQSPGVGGHTLIREVVQRRLSERGALILALPNCRYRDGEVVYGAKMKNFARPDLSLVVKDLAFYRKYLQQHRFRVAITGKHYLFLTAVRP